MPASSITSLQDLCAQTILKSAQKESATKTNQAVIQGVLSEIEAASHPQSTPTGIELKDLKSACLQLLLDNIDQVITPSATPDTTLGNTPTPTPDTEQPPLQEQAPVETCPTPDNKQQLRALRFRLCEAIWSNSQHPGGRLVQFVKGDRRLPSQAAYLFMRTIRQARASSSPCNAIANLQCNLLPSDSRSIKQDIARALTQLIQDQPSKLHAYSFDQIKSGLKSYLTQYAEASRQPLAPSMQYRFDTELDLAAQLLFIELHGSDEGITSATTDYNRPSYINNAFKQYLDQSLAEEKSAPLTLRFLSNLTLTGTEVGADKADCISQQAMHNFPKDYATLGRTYKAEDRIQTCTRWLHSMIEAKQAFAQGGQNKAEFKEKFSARIKQNLISSLHEVNSQKANALQKDMDATLDGFCEQVKKLFPNMSERDIYRAKTNVWAIFVLQRLFQGKFDVTPAAIGYSSLYPLTDSLIDDPNITKDIKKLFFKTFHEKIAKGTPDIAEITSLDIPDSIKDIFIDIWNAFDLIEYQYDRDKNPQLYEAMRELHMAQAHSKAQDFDIPALTSALDTHSVPKEVTRKSDDIFEITTRKGFLSILGDAFLVTGDKLPGPSASFAGHFGTITQFINDAMTIKEDIMEEGHVTPHNYAWMQDNAENSAQSDQLSAVDSNLSHAHFDQITNQVFHYVNWVFDQPEHKALFDDADSKFNFESIKSYLNMKLIMTVAKNQALHSPEFLAHIQQFTPFSLDFMAKLNHFQEKRFEPGEAASSHTQALQGLNTQIKEDLTKVYTEAKLDTKIKTALTMHALKRAKERAEATSGTPPNN